MKPVFNFTFTATLTEMTPDTILIQGDSSAKIACEMSLSDLDDVAIAIIEKFADELNMHVNAAKNKKQSLS